MAQSMPKRKIKDSVFTNLFQDKKYLLRLYKALHPEDGNVTEEDTIHLAPTVSLLYKKTLVFTIKFTLNFFLSPLSFDLPFIVPTKCILWYN